MSGTGWRMDLLRPMKHDAQIGFLLYLIERGCIFTSCLHLDSRQTFGQVPDVGVRMRCSACHTYAELSIIAFCSRQRKCKSHIGKWNGLQQETFVSIHIVDISGFSGCWWFVTPSFNRSAFLIQRLWWNVKPLLLLIRETTVGLCMVGHVTGEGSRLALLLPSMSVSLDS